ncbi:MAG: hypothetical protein Q7K42_06305 [Candidatus Diapherotrites archaeon]|nr:hypothetical protein [Candidatus Diapherotrites archaeon]
MAMEKVLTKFLFFGLIIFFFSFAQAEVAVTISSTQGEEITSMLQDEVLAFNVDAVNLSNSSVQNLSIELSVDKELALVDLSGNETRTKVFNIALLSPGEGARQTIFVKALSKTDNAKIYANFGANIFTNLSATFVQVKDSPLLFNVVLEKKEIDLAEQTKILSTIENVSTNSFSNLELSLIADETIFADEKNFAFQMIAPSQKISQDFVFYPKETIQGEKQLLVQLKFDDETGKQRILQKSLILNIQNTKLSLAMIIALLIFLLVLAFWGLRQHSSKLEVKGTG